MSQLIDCCDICVMSVLKHLIHVFVIMGCIAFVYTGALLYYEDNTEIDKYEMVAMRQTMSLEEIMRGTIPGGKDQEGSDGSVIESSINTYVKKYRDEQRDLMIHPLYIQLQKRSRLTQDFYIHEHEYDQNTKRIDGKTFYRKYMSKSLPCVFRNEAVQEMF